MKLLLIAGLGSFIGGAGRYALGLLFQNRWLYILPFGTLLANLAGCFLIGILFAIFSSNEPALAWRVFLITGILGGFTTFSSFSLETVAMFRDGYITKAFVYILISTVAGLMATWLGMVLIKN